MNRSSGENDFVKREESLTDASQTLERIEFFHRWSPLFCALTISLLAVTAWREPLSWSYLLRAVIIGLIHTVLTIAGWKWELTERGGSLRFMIGLVLIAGGFFWSKDQTFGHNHNDESLWIIAGQFISTVFGVFFALLGALGFKLKRFFTARK